MDNLKLQGKNQDKADALLISISSAIFNKIGKEFGMGKCAVLEIKNSKQIECSGLQLPSRDTVKEVEEDV